MSKTIRTILSVTTISSVALVGLVIFASSNFIQESHAGVSITCENTFLPLDPLEVNVIPSVKVFFTYIVEKEVFDCVDSAGPVNFVREVAIVLKTKESLGGFDLDANGAAPGKILITVIECDKNLNGLVPNCIKYTPGTSVNLVDCAPNTGTSFMEMDSAFIPFGTNKRAIKAVIVEKEIHECNIDAATGLPASFGEVFNIEEFVNNNAPTQKTVICEKEANSGFVVGCVEIPAIVL